MTKKPQAQHEEFHIQSNVPENAARPQSLRVVRQDRHEVKALECKLVIGDRRFDVLNYTSFGIAVATEQDSIKVPAETDASLQIEGLEVARVHVRRLRSEAADRGKHRMAFEIVGEPLDITRVQAVETVKELLQTVAKARDPHTLVPEGFRRIVYETREALEELEKQLNSLEQSLDDRNNRDRVAFEEAAADAVADHLERVFRPVYEEFAGYLKGLSETAVRTSFEFFRSKLQSLIYQSPIAHRSMTRPLGYAGDFEMMNLIYFNEHAGRSLFAKCLHRYYMNHPNAKAVRNRATYLENRLSGLIEAQKKGQPFRILSVASGPAEEIHRLVANMKTWPEGLEIHLLDQDLTALLCAQRKLRALELRDGKKPVIKYFHKAIKNIISEGIDDKYDVVYSAGVFDYFSDPVARLAAKRMAACLKAGGKLIIGNFQTNAANKMLMQMALDWHLIYRSEEELKALYDGLGVSTTVEAEPERVNLFAVVTGR